MGLATSSAASALQITASVPVHPLAYITAHNYPLRREAVREQDAETACCCHIVAATALAVAVPAKYPSSPVGRSVHSGAGDRLDRRTALTQREMLAIRRRHSEWNHRRSENEFDYWQRRTRGCRSNRCKKDLRARTHWQALRPRSVNRALPVPRMGQEALMSEQHREHDAAEEFSNVY